MSSGFILGEEVGSLHSLTHLCQPPLYEGAAKCTYTVAPRVTSCCRQIWIGSYLPTNNFLSTLWILPGWRRIRLLFNDFQPPRDLTCAWITYFYSGSIQLMCCCNILSNIVSAVRLFSLSICLPSYASIKCDWKQCGCLHFFLVLL